MPPTPADYKAALDAFNAWMAQDDHGASPEQHNVNVGLGSRGNTIRTALQAAASGCEVVGWQSIRAAQQMAIESLRDATSEAHDMNVAEGAPNHDVTISGVDAAIILAMLPAPPLKLSKAEGGE